MKKLLNTLLVFSMILSLFVVHSNEVKATSSLSFVNEYEKVGQEIVVDTSALSGDLKYSWSVDGKVVSQDATYTPTQNDNNKFIEVIVNDGTTQYSAKTFLSSLPVIYIDIENGATVTSKDKYLNSEFTLQGNDQYNSETTKLYSGACEIKGRGNSTWSLPKKPYRLKLDKKTDLFGYGKSKHWVLLANYYDTTFLRNKIGYDLSGALGMPYMESVLVDVVMNGEYIGNYQFCEHIRVDDERVEITDWEGLGEDAAANIADANALSEDALGDLEEMMAEDLNWAYTDSVVYDGVTYKVSDYFEYPDLSGGYLMEMDTNYDEVSKFKTDNNVPMMFKAPEFANTNSAMMDYVQTYIQAFEDAVQSDNYTVNHENQTKHYSELFDMQSLVDNWLVQELFFNEDFMKKSTYMYKDHGELFKMGPIWDLDWASGAEQSSAKAYDRWQTTHFNADCQSNQWYKHLVKDPYYLKLVQDRYLEIRDTLIQDMYDSIDVYANEIAVSAQASLDIWRKGKNYTNEISKFKTWLTNRLAFLDQKMADFDTLVDEFDKTTTLLEVTNADGTIPQEDDIYHYAVEAGTKVTLNTSTNADNVEVWVNNQKVEELEVVDGMAAYTHEVSDNSVVQFYGYKNGEVVTRSYTSLTTDTKVRQLIGIEYKAPDKLVYSVGEPLDMTGAKLTALYDDGTTQEVISYDLEGYDAITLGTQSVTVTYNGFTATFEVEVVESNADIIFEKESVELTVGDSYTLNYTVTPTDEKPVWSVENTNIVNIYDGKIVALAEGETVVKATLSNGKYDTCVISVKKKVISDLGEIIDPLLMDVEAGNEDYRDPAINVLDDDYKTVWHTDWHPQTNSREDHYLIFTLDDVHYVNGMKILRRQDGVNGVITQFNLYVRESEDGEWIKVVNEGTLNESYDYQDVSFEAIKTKQIKLEVTKALGNQGDRVFSSAAEIRFTGTKQSPCDKSGLQSVFDTLSTINKDEYVDSSLEELNSALEKAYDVLNNEDATQQDVDQALTLLNDAYKALVKKVFIESITLDKTELTMKKAMVEELTVTINPENTTEDKTITWTSSDEDVVKVIGGTVVSIKPGHATIIATASNGMSATCEVSVVKDFPFTDVSDKQWYYGVINEAYQLGLMTGASETLFKPNANMNRGMVAIVFHRMEGSKKVEYSSIFPDVANKQYYTTSVLWAKQTGVINGYKDGTFKPLRNVSREEMATMIYNFARYKGLDMSASKDITYFSDYSQITPYAVGPLQWAVEKGLMSGKDNGTRLDPLGTATRAECSKMLVQAYKVIYK